MLQIGIAVAVPYATAIFLGTTLGKLKSVGPLLRGVWYTTFWLAVLAQITAIASLALSYFAPINVDFGAALVVGSSLTSTLAMILATVMFSVSRNGHGEEDTPEIATGSSSPIDITPLGGLNDGEGVLVLAGILLAVATTFAVSFFPLRGIVRVTSRIMHLGLLRA